MAATTINFSRLHDQAFRMNNRVHSAPDTGHPWQLAIATEDLDVAAEHCRHVEDTLGDGQLVVDEGEPRRHTGYALQALQDANTKLGRLMALPERLADEVTESKVRDHVLNELNAEELQRSSGLKVEGLPSFASFVTEMTALLKGVVDSEMREVPGKARVLKGRVEPLLARLAAA